MEHPSLYGHSRTRTTSSNVFPSQHATQHHPQQQISSNPQLWRRSPSINTFSTSSSFQPPAAYRTSSHTDLRRSTSSRSVGTTAPATSYVALLRKQKATVWCERAQYEDPRLAAQQRAAKMRANLEVTGGGGRTKTGLSSTGKASKIRHGKAPLLGYAPGETHVGVGGVPIRLSETEVDLMEGSDEDDGPTMTNTHHQRTGSSGRSSIASKPQALSYRNSGGVNGQRSSAGATPERINSMGGQLREEPIVADDSVSGRAHSSGSGSSAAERQDNLGELGPAPKLAANSKLNSALTREKSVKSPEELRRRGSVDERTATLTSGRLYIANPD